MWGGKGRGGEGRGGEGRVCVGVSGVGEGGVCMCGVNVCILQFTYVYACACVWLRMCIHVWGDVCECFCV